MESSPERQKPVGLERHDEVPVRPPDPVPRLHALTADGVRSLQRSAGNAAVGRLLALRSGPVLGREPEIAASDDAIGQRVVDDLIAANDSTTRSATKGVHYPEEYKKLVDTDDPDAKKLWGEGRWSGYANENYWDYQSHMSWVLKKGVDAAAAIKDWLAGPTIAECASVLVAIELDTMRAAVGDNRFNAMFSWLNQPPERGLLKLNQSWGKSSTAGFMALTAEKAAATSGPEAIGRRSVKKGEWYYFYNHPKYLLKHLGGDWQGLNAICTDDTLGAQKYSGFGVHDKTEPEMHDELALAYNQDRNERDYRTLVETCAVGGGRDKKPSETWKTAWDGVSSWNPWKQAYTTDKFPDQIAARDVVDAPPHKIGDTERKGGFVSGVGVKLHAGAVAGARGASPVVQ